MTRINAVIFDFGGVLLKWNPHRMLEPYFSDRAAIEDFLDEIDFMSWNGLQDKGRSYAEGIQELIRQFPQYTKIAPALRHRWEESIDGPIDGSILLLKALKKAGIPLYGLSNWSAETFPIVRQRFDFFSLFDGILISGDAQLIKPDPAIYRLCLAMIRRPPEKCLFIDDSAQNIASAVQLGFDTVHFRSAEDLREELLTRGLL